MKTAAEIVALAKPEILEDACIGVLPLHLIHNFSDLHSFVDANEYGTCEDDGLSDDFIATLNAAQGILDEWIRSGGFIREAIEMRLDIEAN